MPGSGSARSADTEGRSSAEVLHQPRLVALPVAFGGGFALVVQLLALGERQLQFRQALVVPVESGGDDGAPFALHRPDQAVDLLAVQQQFPGPARLAVEAVG